MSRFLLDTHVLLWLLTSPLQLEQSLRATLADPVAEVLVSAASVWEIAIKRALGRLSAPDDLLEVIAQAGFTPLPITPEHAWAAGHLPPHHADPFDRILVAQTESEGLTLVTRDPLLQQYGVAILAA